MSSPIFFVTAATGRQSSGLIAALSSWSKATSTSIAIHGTTRNPSSTQAQALLTHNHSSCKIKLFQADFDDPSTLTAPATNATHAFLNVTPVLTDITAEATHAKSILSTLRSVASTTLQRIVYPSVLSLADPSNPQNFTNLDHHPWMKAYYTSKYSIETSVRDFATSLNINYTLLRPGTFLTNLLPPTGDFMYPGLTSGNIRTAWDPTVSAGWLDPSDIGKFACKALTLPDDDALYKERYRAKIVDIAWHEWTLSQTIDSLNEFLASDAKISKKGTQVKMSYLTPAERVEEAKVNPVIASQQFFNENAHRFACDPEDMARCGVTMTSAAEFWKREAEALRKGFGVEA